MPMVLAYLRGSIVRSFGLGWQCEVVQSRRTKDVVVAGGDVPDAATFAEAMLEKC